MQEKRKNAGKNKTGKKTDKAEAREFMRTHNVIWAPSKRQQAMMTRLEFEGLYGGAAGGGKTDYLLVEALRQVRIREYRAIIFRKTYPELEDLISRSMELYRAAFPKARYNSSRHVWTFPSGAKIYFGSMQYPKDRLKYQGRHFDFVGFDELTHFGWDEYNYLFSRVRSSAPGLRRYIRSTANPGARAMDGSSRDLFHRQSRVQPLWRQKRPQIPKGISCVLQGIVYSFRVRCSIIQI